MFFILIGIIYNAMFILRDTNWLLSEDRGSEPSPTSIELSVQS